MSSDTSSASFFEAKYAAKPDPWSFETDAYEQMRYRRIVEALDGRLYWRAFEPGCSVGVLTERLASYCHLLEAIDASPTAAARARKRCQSRSNVNISVGVLPENLPNGEFDLIIFSEIGYYFSQYDLTGLVDLIVNRLCPGAVLLAAHWLGESSDHKLTGDEVHGVISLHDGLENTLSYRHEESQRARFRLDRWVKA